MSLNRVARESEHYHEPIGFDYLSRLERGHLMPSVPKLATLAAVFGRPLSELVDLYEIEELRRFVPENAGYDLCRRLGMEHLERGEITSALACFLGALDSAKRDGASRQTLAVAHNNVGHVLLRGGRYLTARRYLEEGLLLVESEMSRARLLDNLANVHYQMDDLMLAEILSREARELASDDPVLGPATAATRSGVLLDFKQFREAEILMREALRAYEDAGDEFQAVRQLYNLGHCLVLQGKLGEGLETARSAVARATERGDPYLRATSQFFLGRCLYAAGEMSAAVAPLKTSLELAITECNRNVSFHAAFYLWKLARETGIPAEEASFEEIARQQRVRLEQRSEEARTFDCWLARRHPKTRSQINV